MNKRSLVQGDGSRVMVENMVLNEHPTPWIRERVYIYIYTVLRVH